MATDSVLKWVNHLILTSLTGLQEWQSGVTFR